VGKPEGKSPLGRPRRGWENGIRMDIRDIGWESVEWIQLAQDTDHLQALVNTVMNLRVLAPRNYLVNYLVIVYSVLDKELFYGSDIRLNQL
jgi:hypothetical protein